MEDGLHKGKRREDDQRAHERRADPIGDCSVGDLLEVDDGVVVLNDQTDPDGDEGEVPEHVRHHAPFGRRHMSVAVGRGVRRPVHTSNSSECAASRRTAPSGSTPSCPRAGRYGCPRAAARLPIGSDSEFSVHEGLLCSWSRTRARPSCTAPIGTHPLGTCKRSCRRQRGALPRILRETRTP